MDYFMTENPQTLAWLVGVIQTAIDNGQKVRFAVQGNALSVKRGEGGWSPPLFSDPDPYRDTAEVRNTLVTIVK